jgi:ribosomal RNA-processing protein 12
MFSWRQVSEIIIATKEVNAKTRNAAYELLVTIARAAENPDLGGSQQALVRFFGVIVGGLAGRTPHMVSI